MKLGRTHPQMKMIKKIKTREILEFFFIIPIFLICGRVLPSGRFAVPDPDSGQQFISPSAVVFTPASGPAVPIPHVERLRYDEAVTSADFAGDGDLFVREVVPAVAKPQAVVTVLAPAVMDAIPTGTRGVLSWVMNDAFNGATPGGGAIAYTLTRAVFLRRPVNVPYYVHAETDFLFRASSADGRTSPLSGAPV